MFPIAETLARRWCWPLRTVVLIASGVALSALTAPSLAQETVSSGWQFELTPYLWGAGLDGTVRVNDRPEAGLGVEQSFGDILDMLDFAMMGSFEARKGRWGGIFDGVYFKVSDEGTLTGSRGFASLTAEAAVTQQVYSLAGSYRAVEGRSVIDVVGGARYSSVGWDVDVLISAPPIAESAKRFSETKGWVDPFVGARLQQEVTSWLSLMGNADVGGFGVGSDLTWQGIVGANFAFNSTLVGKLGYRYFSIDYDKDDFVYDMACAGLYVGLGIRF